MDFPLTGLNKFSLLKIEKMSFSCYALNCSSKEFFVSSFLCRKRVPHRNISFQKMVQLVAEVFKQYHYHLTTNTTYQLVWSDATLGFPCHTS